MNKLPSFVLNKTDGTVVTFTRKKKPQKKVATKKKPKRAQ